jgi:hypothetical protein
MGMLKSMSWNPIVQKHSSITSLTAFSAKKDAAHLHITSSAHQLSSFFQLFQPNVLTYEKSNFIFPP